ncbi:NADH-quinone oxidoreductase subunit N [Nitriliruptor alkaliphilus]|uniref:NADH-quinone oxidoreductase subunit N n=1 Tax=Nitriliruptor alkaliphilus TaxID=427918 RepID=UPI000698F507|nr:NADH-quinone oxidoreductase subunit N [Nitriliruptor alkaliphilus]
MILAQTTPTVPIPEIAWSAFAPELLPTIAALLLLLVAVAGRRRQLLVGVPTLVLGVALGAALIARDLVVPGAVAVGFAFAVPAVTAVVPRKPTLIGAWVAAASLLGALVLTVWQFTEQMVPGAATMTAQSAMQGSVANDGIAFFTRLTVYLAALLVLPLGQGYMRDRAINRSEVAPLLLLSVVGMAALGTANDLITLFVALEVLSIALYILCGLARRDRRSQEASLKYFILGAVASAILLYGMALIYTATGSIDLPTIGRTLGLVTTTPVLAALGLALVTVGVGFKVALAPFHLWTPDVYQGAPTNVTAFMAAATKAAGFAAILRLYLVAFPSLEAMWVPALSVLAAITMLYGAYVAVVQHDLKRMLAYSSITHAGYTTIGVVSLSDAGLSATLWYLLTYAVATIGAFGCVIALERRRRGEVTLADLRGLGRSSPALAGILSVCLLSLAGVPATAGFVGKIAIFEAGVNAGLTWLVVVGVISSVIAAFFYLRIAGTMFLEETPVDQALPIVSPGISTGVSVAAALVVYLGIQPQVVLQLADNAAVLVR